MLGSSIAMGPVTTAGRLDVLFEPEGFERGFEAAIVSKELLCRDKDREHLPLLIIRTAELAHERRWEPRIDSGHDIGF